MKTSYRVLSKSGWPSNRQRFRKRRLAMSPAFLRRQATIRRSHS
jgi:hypothetical protein